MSQLIHEQFNCQQCGWCCRNIVINVAYSDIIRWQKENRSDILCEVSFLANYPKAKVGGFYFHKTAFNPKQPCPFYKDGCIIYETRPVACQDYPLASSEPEGCTAYVKPQRRTVRRIKQRQFKDFKKANQRLPFLLKILKHARMVNGN